VACPDIYILRHGETEWNRQGRLQGWLDSPLTELGRAQAARQGAVLAAEGAVDLPLWSSPAPRALATAALALPGRSARPDPRLREITLGPWDGLTRAEIAALSPGVPLSAHPFHWYDLTPGERFEGLRARVAAFMDELDGPSVIVTHGITSRFLRGAALGLDLDGIAALPGGQGVVWHLSAGTERVLG